MQPDEGTSLEPEGTTEAALGQCPICHHGNPTEGGNKQADFKVTVDFPFIADHLLHRPNATGVLGLMES